MDASTDRLLFIQFMHPGKEHRPDAGRTKYWNTGQHKRKFVKNAGRYLSDQSARTDDDICFWCEWEPQSEVLKDFDNMEKGYPRFLYSPYWTPPISHGYINGMSKKAYQNTDPFIFETPFKYALCQQQGKMKYLGRGSVILFGSQVERRHFSLDTVFVVDRWFEYSNRTYAQDLKDVATEEYLSITMRPAWEKEKDLQRESFRLYFGASYENPVEGMFSFFPCLPFEGEPRGFRRPIINIADSVSGKPVIDGAQNTGKRYTELSKLETIKLLWDRVVKQVTEQSLYLGIATDLPEKR